MPKLGDIVPLDRKIPGTSGKVVSLAVLSKNIGSPLGWKGNVVFLGADGTQYIREWQVFNEEGGRDIICRSFYASAKQLQLDRANKFAFSSDAKMNKGVRTIILDWFAKNEALIALPTLLERGIERPPPPPPPVFEDLPPIDEKSLEYRPAPKKPAPPPPEKIKLDLLKNVIQPADPVAEPVKAPPPPPTFSSAYVAPHERLSPDAVRKLTQGFKAPLPPLKDFWTRPLAPPPPKPVTAYRDPMPKFRTPPQPPPPKDLLERTKHLTVPDAPKAVPKPLKSSAPLVIVEKPVKAIKPPKPIKLPKPPKEVKVKAVKLPPPPPPKLELPPPPRPSLPEPDPTEVATKLLTMISSLRFDPVLVREANDRHLRALLTMVASNADERGDFIFKMKSMPREWQDFRLRVRKVVWDMYE